MLGVRSSTATPVLDSSSLVQLATVPCTASRPRATSIASSQSVIEATVYRWATDFYGHQPSFASITLSSLAPSAPAALGYFVLAQLTERARLVFGSVTAIIVVI